MKKIILLASAVALIASSCVDTIVEPLTATNNKMVKTGVAEANFFLGIPFGKNDLSAATAAKNGGITKIATVDHSVTLGIFSEIHKVIVTGE